jgi:prepilin-type N-terminal cleavage/methylation domain-containing protein
MTRFKIKPLKGFSLVELLVSIVIIAAITMLISSAFIGMMAQKKNLQVKETAEDMTREIISAVTRNSDNLDLLLKKLKTETPAIIGTPPISQTQYQNFKYCPEIDPVGTTPPRCTYQGIGFRIDLTDQLKLDGSDNPNVNQNSYDNATAWLKFVPGANPQTTSDYDLLMDNTVVPNRHPGDTLNQLVGNTGGDSQEFRFFKKPPSNITATTTINPTVISAIPTKERYRYGIFSLVDITSLNMKMKLLPKNDIVKNSWNTKVYLHIATDSEGVAPDYLEPQKATDRIKKGLVLTAEVKYSLRNNGNINTSSEGTSVILTKKFHPSMTEGDSLCMGNSKPASCPICRSNPWASGCNPCDTYNMTTGTISSVTSITDPNTSTNYTCPHVVP